MSVRVGGSWSALIILTLSVMACEDERLCNRDDECSNGQVCDLESGQCAPRSGSDLGSAGLDVHSESDGSVDLDASSVDSTPGDSFIDIELPKDMTPDVYVSDVTSDFEAVDASVVDVAFPDDLIINDVLVSCADDDDTDNDGVCNTDDICPNDPDPDQRDSDHDGLGDVCDDSDNDGFFDNEELTCGTIPNDSRSFPNYCNEDGRCDDIQRCRVEWVLIDGGEFLMGSPLGSPGSRADETPMRNVEMNAFLISRTEITVGQYRECVLDDGACTFVNENHYDVDCNFTYEGRGDHPINCISWNQAKEFALWSNARLPTEAEWEYAARSRGLDQTYPWGNDQATCEFSVMDDTGDNDGCGEGHTLPVCSRPSGNTIHELCDMAGNVAEWVEDLYADDYENAWLDGRPYLIDGDEHVYRGGHWFYGSEYLRVRRREHYPPSTHRINLGFRLARDVPPAKSAPAAAPHP